MTPRSSPSIWAHTPGGHSATRTARSSAAPSTSSPGRFEGAYGGFLTHLTAWCEHHQIPYQGVPVGTIKKHATGKGNAGKDAMVAAARARGFAQQDDNEADALALLAWAVAQEDVV